MAQTAEKIRPVKGNAIQVTIDRLVGERREPGLRDEFREKICEVLKISNRYTMLLNNTGAPATMTELGTISQILGVSVDELIQLED